MRIEGEPPVLTALGKQPCIVINSEGRLKLTEGETCVLSCVDTYTPEPVLYVRPPAYCSYPRHRAACRRARVPASRVPTACRAVTPARRGGPGSARARRDTPHRRRAREQYHPLRVRDGVLGRRVRVPRRLRRTLPAPADRTRRPSLPQAEADADTCGLHRRPVPSNPPHPLWCGTDQFPWRLGAMGGRRCLLAPDFFTPTREARVALQLLQRVDFSCTFVARFASHLCQAGC